MGLLAKKSEYSKNFDAVVVSSKKKKKKRTRKGEQKKKHFSWYRLRIQCKYRWNKTGFTSQIIWGNTFVAEDDKQL